MKMRFCPLFSGSSGNCVYISCGDEAVIVDAGVSAASILAEAEKAGVDMSIVKAVTVTHEHTDHINGAGVLARKLNVPLYATEGTWEGMGKRAGKLAPWQKRVISRGSDFYIGAINVLAFPTPHDCIEPCGYVFSAGGMRAAVATDLGYITDTWLDAVKGSDIVLLESNYDPDMLDAGKYPYELKRRIRGRKGHLSNEDAGNAAVKLVRSGTKCVILGHLSKENNFPELAYKTGEDILAQNDIYPGRDLRLEVARRDGCTGVFELDTDD